jgi:hypothetical protein
VAVNKVLLLTNTSDGLHSAKIEEKLIENGGEFVRLDTDSITLGKSNLSIFNHRGTYNIILDDEYIGDVDSIWFRRPYSFEFNIEDDVQRLNAEEEVRDVLDGMFEILSSKFWVSKPSSINRARLKPLQVNIAKECGLNVPDTVITNSPDVARNFCDLGKTVFKPLSGYCLEYEGILATAFTTLVTDVIYENLELVKNQHVMLQRYVTKEYEIRVTCVGNMLFPVKISADGFDEIVDHRTPDNYNSMSYEPIVLPHSIAEAIRKLVTTFSLEYATVDLAVSPNGEYTFFEVNPIGQWYWIEEETGLEITNSLAKHLLQL